MAAAMDDDDDHSAVLCMCGFAETGTDAVDAALDGRVALCRGASLDVLRVGHTPPGATCAHLRVVCPSGGVCAVFVGRVRVGLPYFAPCVP